MRSDHTDLPLFGWKPPCRVIAFPLVNRVGKIRDVAGKLLDKTTDRHAEQYRKQVTDALISQLDKLGIPEAEQDEHLGAFWSKVHDEMLRKTYRGSNNPTGAA